MTEEDEYLYEFIPAPSLSVSVEFISDVLSKTGWEFYGFYRDQVIKRRKNPNYEIIICTTA